jgi:hypothetical protein
MFFLGGSRPQLGAARLMISCRRLCRRQAKMRRRTIVLDEMRAALEQVALYFAGTVKTRLNHHATPDDHG